MAAKVATSDRLSVLFVAILAMLFLHERLSARNWLGAALLAGAIFLMAR